MKQFIKEIVNPNYLNDDLVSVISSILILLITMAILAATPF